MVKAVIFDCFGVLYPDTFWTVVRKYARDMPEKRPLFHDLVKRADLGMISIKEFWDEVAEMLGQPREVIDKDVVDMGGIDIEMLEYITELRKRDLKIGLISNVGHGFIERVFGDHKPKDYFDNLTLSSEAGFIKPDPRIYLLAANNLQVSTEACYFIDDSEKNINGAHAVGMQAALYTDFDEMKERLESALAKKE